MEGIRLDEELVLKTSAPNKRCEFESHGFRFFWRVSERSGRWLLTSRAENA